jgi:hypothetical protein
VDARTATVKKLAVMIHLGFSKVGISIILRPRCSKNGFKDDVGRTIAVMALIDFDTVLDRRRAIL